MLGSGGGPLPEPPRLPFHTEPPAWPVPVEIQVISSLCFLVLLPLITFLHNVLFCFSVPCGAPPSVQPGDMRTLRSLLFLQQRGPIRAPGLSLGAHLRWTLPTGPWCLEVRPDVGQGHRHITDGPTVC